MSHCDIMRAPRPLLGPFVLVFNDCVGSSVVILDSHLPLQSFTVLTLQEMQWFRCGFWSPPTPAPSTHRPSCNTEADMGNKQESLVIPRCWDSKTKFSKLKALTESNCNLYQKTKFSTDLEEVYLASPMAQMVRNLPAVQEIQVWSLGWEDPVEKEMATHSSILALRILWTEGSQRVGHDWSTNTHTHRE